MQPGMELALWAPEGLVSDPVAIDLDDQGIAYVTSSSRVNMPLDIRGHPTWTTTAHTLKTVDDLVQFYRRELAPDQSAKNAWIEDSEQGWLARPARLPGIQGTRGSDPRHQRRRHRRRVAGRRSKDSTTIRHGTSPAASCTTTARSSSACPRGSIGLPTRTSDGVLERRVRSARATTSTRRSAGTASRVSPSAPTGGFTGRSATSGLNVVDKTGRRWAYPNQGAVMRANADGSDFEVFATGIRNLQEFAFDEHGNLISVDNDGDHTGETERLVYIPDGSDSGWRSNWQYGKYTDPKNNRYNVWMDEEMFKPRFEGQAAHIMPPIAPYHAGPSGMVYNPGTALSEEWRNHFFVSSFPGAAAGRSHLRVQAEGRWRRVRARERQGAAARHPHRRHEVRADGALYLTDWITGWRRRTPGGSGSSTRPRRRAARRGARSRRCWRRTSTRAARGRLGLLRGTPTCASGQKAQFELVRRERAADAAGRRTRPAHRLESHPRRSGASGSSRARRTR